jgi:hypothetical protein
MARIQFKAKVKTMYNMDDSVAYEYVSVPMLNRNHCDMPAFRDHPKYGSYANSDLFIGMLNGIRKTIFGNNNKLKLSDIPPNVSVDTSGFLAVITINV